MKWLGTFAVKIVLPACITGVAIAGFYVAWEPYVDSFVARVFRRSSDRWNTSGDLNADNQQNHPESFGEEPARPLPAGWKVSSKGSRFWVTHYNPNGSVADSLPFDSTRDLYSWLNTHPDCCDVNLAKVIAGAQKDTEPATSNTPKD